MVCGDWHDARVTTPISAHPAFAKRHRLVVVLALTSGATDAVGFLALGAAFTSVMTGNLVLLGVYGAQGVWFEFWLTGMAIVSFVVGAAVGARIAGATTAGDRWWPRPVTWALIVEAVLFVAYAVIWWSTGSGTDEGWWAPMLALNAGALGLQSSAIQRFGVSGLSTTYLTGTLTTVVINLTHGKGLRSVTGSLALLVGLVIGAAIAAALLQWARPLVPVFQLATLLVVLVLAMTSRELAEERPH